MVWLRELWTQIWITLVVAAVSLALYTSLGRQMIPLLETYQPDLEQELSRLTGQPVSIGQLQGDWHMLSPLVRLRDVQLGPAGDGIHIDAMEAELDVSASLFYRLPVFRRIDIQGVSAELHHLTQQQWRIGSDWLLDFTPQPAPAGSQSASGSSQRPLWLRLLELQQNILFRDWRIVGFDPENTREDLHIDQLLWRNSGDSHELDGQVAWGREQMASIRLMASLNGELWPWQKQDGEVYLKIEPQEWSRWVPAGLPGGLDVQQFTAGAEAWLSIRDGDLNALYLDADIPQLRIHTRAEELQLSAGHLLAAGQHNGDDWHLQIRPQFKEALPFQQFSLSAVTLPQQKGWQIGIPQLDIAAAREFLLRHELLPEPFRRYIDNTNGRGAAEDVRISLLPGSPWQLDVRAALQEVSSDAYNGIPAFSGLSGSVHLQPAGGLLTVAQDDLGMQLSGIYDQPWTLKNLSGRFYWAIHPDYSQLQVRGVQAGLADSGDDSQSWPFSAELALALPRHDSHSESAVRLLVGMPQAPARLKEQLVPAVLNDAVREWIGQSITAGQFSDGSFIMQGTLEHDHPRNSLTTQLYLGFSDAGLTYLSDWPAVTDLQGRLLLRSPELEVWIDEGSTLGGRLVSHSGRVKLTPDAGGNTHLSVNARLKGNSDEALRYFTGTPLQQVVNGAFDDWRASGPVSARLSLDMPLGTEHATPDVQLDAEFTDNHLTLSDLRLSFANLTGAVRYSSRAGLTSDHLEGDTFGGHFTAGIASHKRSGGFDTVLTAHGGAYWKDFRRWLPLFLLDPVTGQLNYDAQLVAGADGVRFSLDSDLAGTRIDLPYPFGKTADDRGWPLSVQVSAGQETRINLAYDDRVRAVLALDRQGLNRGQIYLGNSEPFLPGDKGIEVKGHISEAIVAADWWETWQHMMALMAQEEQAPPAATQGSGTQTSGPVRSIDLSLDAVDAWGMAMGPTRVQGGQQWNEWNFDVDSTLVKGRAVLKTGNEPLQLDLDYIHMATNGSPAAADGPESSVAAVAAESGSAPAEAAEEADPLQNVTPGDFPAADVKLAELYIGTHNFGRWNVEARPAQNGLALKIIDSDMKGLVVRGDVLWQRTGDQHSTSLDVLQISSSDIGKVQRAFRQDAVIEGKDMRATLQLSWQGSPLGFDSRSLSGLASLRIRDGNMAAEGTGALKAFGALNFNSIARRVRLDFSDLYQPGVAFDTLKGKANIDHGLLTLAEPLSMDGPGGKFLISGSTSLPDETLDMKMVVTFPVSSTLPLVALLAGLAPPVAASIYVTEKLIGDELARFTSASYDLKGTWQNPDVKINQAFDNKIEGRKERGLWQRIKSIFTFGGDD